MKRKYVLRGSVSLAEKLNAIAQLKLKALFQGLEMAEANVTVGEGGTSIDSGRIEKCDDEPHKSCAVSINTDPSRSGERNDAGEPLWRFAGSPEGVIPPDRSQPVEKGREPWRARRQGPHADAGTAAPAR
ncbi:hypothetical protein [Pyxidicoccus trucidator]|uniref:hypothetical protein n=1 Tax=Pyxidicoccus trucidator TaxID=2709662 RepID=UPI0013D9C1D7|nr:hypothetical protein [Pyxidicoccus trucidator]